MNKLRYLIMFCLVGSMSFSPFGIAGEDQNKNAVNKIAEIMYRLKHFPSPQGRSDLKAIINAPTSTENERIIAAAMMNMQHEVLPNDALLLKKISANNSSSKHERELAELLLNFNHRPTKQDKSQLKEMMK